jgi:hypothetical protein
LEANVSSASVVVLGVPCIDSFSSVTIEPGVPANSILPLASRAGMGEVDAYFLHGHHIQISIKNGLD